MVFLCREGRDGDAIDRRYSPNIVSIESTGNETMPAEVRGIDGVMLWERSYKMWHSRHSRAR